jgi:hypothetical protein
MTSARVFPGLHVIVIALEPQVVDVSNLEAVFPQANIAVSEGVIVDGDPPSRPRDRSVAIGWGAMGCWLAHRRAWKLAAKLAQADQYVAILEEDAAMTAYGRRWFPSVLKKSQRLNINFMQLGSNRHSDPTSPVHGQLQRFRNAVEVTGLALTTPLYTQALTSVAHASLIRVEFAKWLAAAEPDFMMPVDNWLRALALDPRLHMLRTRQDLFAQRGGHSLIDKHGR